MVITKIPSGAEFQPEINGQTKSVAQNQRLDEINSTIDSMLKAAGATNSNKVDSTTLKKINNFYDEISNIKDNAVDFDTNIRSREMMERLSAIKGPSFLDKLSGSFSHSFSVMAKAFQPISNYFSKKDDEPKATKEYYSFSNGGDEEAIKAAKEAQEKIKNNKLGDN